MTKILSIFALAISLLLGNLSFVSAEETQVSGAGSVSVTAPPPIKPVGKMRQDIKAVNQEKRTDIKNIRTDANKKILDERAVMKTTQMKAVEGGLTPKERVDLRSARLETRGDIKEIRMEQFGEVKLRREEAREDIKISIEERRMKMASSTDARKEERKQKALERAAEMADKMVKRISAAIERLEKFTVRIQSRIDKIKTAGGTTTEAETALAEAKVQIGLAKDGLAQISSAFAAAALLPNPKDGSVKIQEAVKLTNSKIKSAHEALTKAIQGLTGQKGAQVEASTVIQTSTPSDETSQTSTETGTTVETSSVQ